ncbi:hypothetical protein [Rhodococcus pyridinivorans]|uniref:hypothetical protein n=1 Tax=Rhodococcus pyridinivorans TaxID=103816 RepID=UPI003AAD1D93
MADARYVFRLDQGRLGQQVQPIMARKAASLTRRISAQARVNVPVRTGFLGRSIHEDPLVFSGPFRLSTGVTATADYAAAVHDGTRPHVIRARNGQYLKFPGRNGPVFARSVNHPGTRPRPFLRNAAEQVLRADGLA